MLDFVKLLQSSSYIVFPLLFHFLLLSSMIILCYPLPGEFTQLSKIFQLGFSLHFQPYFLIFLIQTFHSDHLCLFLPVPTLTSAMCISTHWGTLSCYSLITWSSLIFPSPISSKKSSHQTHSDHTWLWDGFTWNLSPASSSFSVFTNTLAMCRGQGPWLLIFSVLSNMQ